MIKISNKNKKMINNFFDNPEIGLKKIARDKSSQDDEDAVNLVCEVIKSGFLELDYKFIFDGACENYCRSLLLDYEFVLYAFSEVEKIIFKEG
jgi:hypothetical protein